MKTLKRIIVIIALIAITFIEWNIAQEIKADEAKYQVYVRSITE